MLSQFPLRQRIRKALILLSFLLFPLTMNYFSPYVIVEAASQGIVNGSLVMFTLLFAASLFLGRAWCGWLCPAGAMQEISEPVNVKPVNGRKVDWIKWLIWVPWVGLIVWLVSSAGGYRRIDLLMHTQGGVSVAGSPDRPIFIAYIIYYLVIALFLGQALLVGRRASCHTVCWMAPFMISGRWIRNRFGWASLRLTADADACSDCKKCTSNCPMSLDVNAMVRADQMENLECILCGTCVDNCSKEVIHYAYRRG
ncbi:MAG: 4Fe-4S binding protein [Anaerolineales bacterium]|nr:4Fe-4S binding protein [Anaerolineales bacterium]